MLYHLEVFFLKTASKLRGKNFICNDFFDFLFININFLFIKISLINFDNKFFSQVYSQKLKKFLSEKNFSLSERFIQMEILNSFEFLK